MAADKEAVEVYDKILGEWFSSYRGDDDDDDGN